jgi:hypothetical protein
VKSSKKYVVREVRSGTFHVRKRRSGAWQDAAVVPPSHATKSTAAATSPASEKTRG